LPPTKRPVPQAESPSKTALSSPWLLYALLTAITLAAYCNSFGLGLAFDAHPLLADARIHSATTENLRLIVTKNYWWPAPVERLYRPLTTLSFLLNYAILGNGTQPAGYHVLNVLLHLLNVWLVFALAQRLLRRPWPAFFAAALWAVHPVGTDSVANIAGRADLLAAGGLLGGLLVYDAWTRQPQPRWPLYAALAALAAWAVFSKETGAMLLPAMLLWDLARGFGGRDGMRRRGSAYLSVAGVLAAYLWIRLQVFATLPWPVEPFVDNPLRGASFWVARWTAIKVIGMELWLLVWPVRLAADRAFGEIPLSGFADPRPWIALGVIIVILIAAFRLRSKDPIWFWCAGFFGLMLLPASNLVVSIGATMAERFLYLPSVAFAIALSAVCYRYLPPRYVPCALATVVVLLSVRTLARNPDWNNDLALMGHDSATAPHSFRVRETHGEYLYDVYPQKLDEAIAEVEVGWNILRPLPPDRSAANIPPILALLYGVKGDQVGATTPAGRAWFEKALALLQRADTISRAGEQAFETEQARHGRPLTRRWAVKDVYIFLGMTYTALGRRAEALAAYRYARGIDPQDIRAYDGAVATAQRAGDPEQAAVIALQKSMALDLAPSALPELRSAYANVPGAACAFDERGALVQHCPPVHNDLCRAVAELADTFADARLSERAARLRNGMGQSYGCH
jgi:hypothetical protein